MNYTELVTFQEAVTSQTASGQVVADSYENVDGLADLPARIIPRIEEEAGERMVTTRDLFELIVQGDRAVTSDMVALADHQGTPTVFNVLRVAQPPHDWPSVLATIVIAERVAI